MLQTAGIVAGVVSVVLGIMAVFLSVYFYTQSKNTEKEITNALAGMKAQTDALQRLAGRQMDRLIKGVTEDKPYESTLFYTMVSVIKDIPNIASQLQGTSGAANAQAWMTEAITSYIATYYYAGIANVASQFYLPPLADLSPDDPTKRFVDSSAADFAWMEGILGRVDASALRNNRLYHLYTEALTEWKPNVKDSSFVYKERRESSG